MDLVKRFEIYLVNLDPTIGSEINKTRPAVIISPDEMNDSLRTIIIAPMTTTVKGYPSRIAISFDSKIGEIALDQIRSIDKRRLIKKLGKVKPKISEELCARIKEIFAY